MEGSGPFHATQEFPLNASKTKKPLTKTAASAAEKASKSKHAAKPVAVKTPKSKQIAKNAAPAKPITKTKSPPTKTGPSAVTPPPKATPNSKKKSVAPVKVTKKTEPKKTTVIKAKAPAATKKAPAVSTTVSKGAVQSGKSTKPTTASPANTSKALTAHKPTASAMNGGRGKPDAAIGQPKQAILAKPQDSSAFPTIRGGTQALATPPKPVLHAVPKDPIPPPSNTNPEIVAKIRSVQAQKELRKDLAQPAPKTSLTPLTPIPAVVKGKDRLVLMVRDPYWIHAHWDITRQSVDRAKASLAENWHSVKPILRLLKLDDSGTTNNAEVVHRDIEIHGGVRNWYVEVESPPSRFKMLMGYLTVNNRFYELARSNTVVTPAPGGKEATDDHWADIATDAEQIYSMSGGYGDDTQTGDLTEVFEERLKRTMDADVLSQFGSGAEGSLKRHKQFHFDVNAELIVFGSTHPDAHVAVGSEPVKVRSDGSFSIRLPLPDRRQVLPATAKSRDGVDEQTVVIAVERNTKVMEPVSSDTEDL